ncbi:TIGR03618 family F420-dependent PPOX class oxidoreductase [Lentzea sp. DG1S-22]|uniref:TIGR03618 family F420-dependent PPOX class oxidoreductase n=1 Tax=unclassified Lentzea TaxID=2643253 RepID=UPI001F182A19|nr:MULTISPECIES: TIGR03618 family F420-dependent PPOX class oxidoreductase [unclassified Lentzea]MCG8921885.1 TIGR03618 family F420-dependent PPOX class oxidoreductase [Lentzea sp. CC55]WVH80942.1 TIGR03618 family F420-dependent PPOX class oxidoreductase [Lentzea sp. DG1S-22]
MRCMSIERGPEFAEFWAERHLCTLSTVRRDGTPHVVPVGVTLDAEAGVARIITHGASWKVKHVRAAGYAAVCQVDGRRWSTVEGPAVVRDDVESVREAERRYALRYREPRVNPERVVIEIQVRRVSGSV